MRIDDYLDLDAVFAPFGYPRRRQRRRQARRRFGRGGLKLAILALVEERPMHGYEVMQVLSKRSGGLYRPSPGSVYPTLQLLDDQGFVTVEAQDGKKVYTITDAGREHLDRNREAVERIFGRASEFTGADRADDACGSAHSSVAGAADLARYVARLGQTTLQGCFRWAGDERFVSDAKNVLDRALEELDAAWDQARERSRAHRAGDGDDARKDAAQAGGE